MNKCFLIDIGSSDVKVYLREDHKVYLLERKTLDFKEGIDENALSYQSKIELFHYFKHLVERHLMTNKNTKLYATGFFREIKNKKDFVEEFFKSTGLFFNIISCDLEAFYLEKACSLIDGVNIQEACSVTICGSFNKHLSEIESLINRLKSRGISVLSPQNTEVIATESDFVIFKHDVVINHNTWAVEELHLKAIDRCDFVIACNFDGYIGVSTTFELEHAYRAGKKIVFIENNEIADMFGKRIGKYPMPCEVGIL